VRGKRRQGALCAKNCAKRQDRVPDYALERERCLLMAGFILTPVQQSFRLD